MFWFFSLDDSDLDFLIFFIYFYCYLYLFIYLFFWEDEKGGVIKELVKMNLSIF